MVVVTGRVVVVVVVTGRVVVVVVVTGRVVVVVEVDGVGGNPKSGAPGLAAGLGVALDLAAVATRYQTS